MCVCEWIAHACAYLSLSLYVCGCVCVSARARVLSVRGVHLYGYLTDFGNLS